MKKEIELKFCPIDKEATRKKLTNAGFKLITPEFMMHRIVFDNPHFPDRWGRVRKESDKTTMAIKRVLKETIDGTEEAETIVQSVEDGVSFMNAAGFIPKSNQENYREIWQKGCLEATLDTWPGLPTALELESVDEESIYDAISALGFNKNEAMFGSIDIAYEYILGIPRDYICKLSEITFANPPKKA